MSAIGINAVFSRIATIERRVGSLAPSAEFATMLNQASDQTRQSQLQSTAIDEPVSRDLTLGQLIGLAPSTTPAQVGFRAGSGSFEWSTRIPDAGRPYIGAITEAADREGIEPELLAALVWTESEFQADAISRSGAIGLGQLMPGTAAGLGVDPTDATENLRGAARYLKAQIDRFGSVELGLAAYNAGPGRVVQSGGIPNIQETQAYVPRVLDRFRLLGGSQ